MPQLNLGFDKDAIEKDLDENRVIGDIESPWHDSEVGPQPEGLHIPSDRFSSEINESDDVFHDSELGEQPGALKAPSFRLSGSDLSSEEAPV